MTQFTLEPNEIIKANQKPVHIFKYGDNSENIDHQVVESFGEEWKKFQNFEDEEIDRIGKEYFDILLPYLKPDKTYLGDFGCGTGRWSKYLAPKVAQIEAIDPSESIFAASNLLSENTNVRLSRTSIDHLPFEDNSFDIVISVGVLHHIPDTKKAMRSCVEKTKINGHCFFYLYYNLEGEPFLNRTLFSFVNALRKLISGLPVFLKKVLCDIIALFIYFPLAKSALFFESLGLKKIASKIPLSYYRNKSFYVMRNDSLDRFGTQLEQRFSEHEIKEMMESCGLVDIQISPSRPKYCAVGQRSS
ncbi:MAG: class I SAM-dependent methyltransferase [Bacteroidota bacterium]